ncbi:MAG: TrmB family transcriptional regulator [Methanobacteriaceae archaeon]|nr:TrmB family transcriptional regulator [Methanobacteriaceae archaeon]
MKQAPKYDGGIKITINRNTLDALKILGLTDYEIQAYTATISIISGTATEISFASNVPRSKIYEVLKSLSKKGFVEIIRGKPLKFNVIPPHEVFQKSRNNIKEQLDEAEKELNRIYEEQIPNVPAPIWLVHGPDKNMKKELEIISRAKNSLFIISGFMFKDEAQKFKESLNKASKRGVHARAVVAPLCNVDDDKIDVIKELGQLNIEMKIFQLPHIKLIVRDEKEMLITFCKLKDEKIISQTAIGIWNQYSEFVETISGVYNFIWTTELFNKLSVNQQ